MKRQSRPKGLRDVGGGKQPAKPPVPTNVERLVAVAIIRHGETHHGFRGHWELRQSLGDADPMKRQLYDEEGFWTSQERFVSRREAREIGKVSGQVSPDFGGRDLLSSDINW